MHEARIRARARALPSAFLDELARPNLPLSETHAVIAGLVVLRVVDRWVAGGCRSARVPAGARSAVADLEPGNPARGILGAVLDAMESTGGGATTTVVQHFLAYGQASGIRGQVGYGALCVRCGCRLRRSWQPRHRPYRDAWFRSRLLPARCTLVSRKPLAAYHRCPRRASQANERILRSGPGDTGARWWISRAVGSSEADGRFDDIVARAGAAQSPGRSRHGAPPPRDRCRIRRARRRRQPYSSRFVPCRSRPDPSEHDRVLFDIGESLRMAGMRDPARDAFLVLSCTGQEPPASAGTHS